MNFRPLPPPVQAALNPALLQILRETPLLKYPTVQYYQRIDDAVALYRPHYDFADLHGGVSVFSKMQAMVIGPAPPCKGVIAAT